MLIRLFYVVNMHGPFTLPTREPACMNGAITRCKCLAGGLQEPNAVWDYRRPHP